MSLRTRLFLLIFVLGALFVTGSSVAYAQVDRGGIVGTIFDQAGARVPAVQVTVTNLATNQTTTVTTNDKGDYAASLLKIGTYSVRAEKSGFQKIVEGNVEVAVNQTARVDLTLKVGSTGEVVQV